MITTYTPYSNPALEAYVKSTLTNATANVHLTSRTTGITTGENNLDLLFHTHHLEYQAIIDHINKVLQAQGTKFSVNETREQADQEIQHLSIRLADTKAQFIPLENRVKNTPIPKRYKTLLPTAAIAIIAFTDALYARETFELWLGLAYLEALLFSLIFAGAFAMYAHYLPRVVMAIKDRNLKKVIIAAVVIATGVWFYYMGIARANQINLVQGITEHTPWPFAVISSVLMGIAVGISAINSPSKEEREAIDQYNALKKEYDDMAADIHKTEEAIKQCKKDYADLRINSAAAIEFGRMLEDTVITEAERAFSQLQVRMVQQLPPDAKTIGIERIPYPYTFKRYFNF